MKIIPAIDLKDGRCVRLRQGRMDSSTIFNEDPADQARTWQDLGASRIHVVDLDGSVHGVPKNRERIREIVSAVTVPVQLGGGIRDTETIGAYLDTGVSTVIIGTLAVRDPERTLEMLRAFPGSVAIGIDAVNGNVAVEGWTQATQVKASDAAARLEQGRPVCFIYTDIERDGMMRGPNVEATRAFAESTAVPVILSGGMTTPEDLKKVMTLAEVGVTGVIIGRALYEGTIDLEEAVRTAEKEHAG